MVRLQVKHGGRGQGEEWEFLYECPSTFQIEEIAHEIVQISNLQSKVGRLLIELEPRLLNFHGNPKSVPLIRALSEAKSYASKDQVLNNKAISYYVFKDRVRAVKREVMENFQLLGFENSSRYCMV